MSKTTMNDFFDVQGNQLKPKRLTIEETYKAMIEIDKLKKRKLELTAYQLDGFSHVQATPIYDEAQKIAVKKSIISSIIGFIVGIPLPLISPLLLGAIFGFGMYGYENRKMVHNGLKKELEQAQINKKNAEMSAKQELAMIDTNITTLTNLLNTASIVPIRYQKMMYIQKMLQFKQNGFVKTDNEAIAQVVEHYGLH